MDAEWWEKPYGLDPNNPEQFKLEGFSQNAKIDFLVPQVNTDLAHMIDDGPPESAARVLGVAAMLYARNLDMLQKPIDPHELMTRCLDTALIWELG